MSSIATYAPDVTAALTAWINAGASTGQLSPLARLLGCRHAVTDSAGVTRVVETDQPGTAMENIVRSTLVTMLLAYDPKSIDAEEVGQVIGNGVIRNGRWRACIERIDSAYKFAGMVFRLFERAQGRRFRTSAAKDLHFVLMEDLPALLVDWVKPADLEARFVRRVLAKALFGQVWCDLMLSDLKMDDSIADLVLTTRPRFLDGLVSAQAALETESLPTLDCG